MAADAEPYLFSIVMPTYRRAHTLGRTLETVVAQTYRRWELILVDNAGDAAVPFADPRIRLHVQAERASASYARNRGLGHATGDLVCFFDDDDEMYPGYLRTFADAFQAHPRAKLVRCGMLVAGFDVIDRGYSTPSSCLRREHATPTWEPGANHDRRYFKAIVQANGWSEETGEVVVLPDVLCACLRSPSGGLRSGNL